MPQNPILDAPAVREARLLPLSTSDLDDPADGPTVAANLDAYATAILAEVRRRVGAMETEGPDESPEGRPVMVPMPFGNYLDRAAVLRVLDGRDA